MKLLLILLLLLPLVSTQLTCSQKPSTLLKLSPHNIVIINTAINHNSESNFISALYSISTPDIYIYLNTPGGSVSNGYRMIQAIETLTLSNKTVHCIADYAASMGFAIFQSCPNRYILPSSILMQHQMSFNLEGPIEHNKNYLAFIEDIEVELNTMQAERLGLSLENFKQLTISDWWLYGKHAINHNAADQVVQILCDFDPKEHTFNNTMSFMGFKYTNTYSLCPLIKSPLYSDLE